jgi:hypothetical protein
MSKQDKAIGYIILVHCVLGSLWTLWFASHIGYPVVFLASNLCLVALGVAAGIAMLRRHQWAIRLSVMFYLLQLVHVFSTVLQWSFTLGASFIISAGWFDNGQVGVNLFALGMLFWLSARAVAPNYSSKPTC